MEINTNENYNTGGGNAIRTGTWAVETDSSISIIWEDGNSAILTFIDADNMTGVSGLDNATITLTRQ